MKTGPDVNQMPWKGQKTELTQNKAADKPSNIKTMPCFVFKEGTLRMVY